MKNFAPVSRALLASSLTLAMLAGCQGTPTSAPSTSGSATPGASATATPAAGTNAPVTPVQSTAPAAAQAAPETVAVAEDLAGLLAAEREAEDLDGLAAEEEKAGYAILSLDENGKARVAPEGMAVITAMPGAEDEGRMAPGPRQAKPRLTKAQRDKLRADAIKRAGDMKAQFEQKAMADRKEAAKRKLAAAAKAKLEERAKTRREKVKGRLEAAKAKMDKAREALKNAEWVSNGDGTKTQTVSFEHKNDTTTRSRKVVRTVREDDNVLVSLIADFTDTKANGTSTVTNRAKTLNEDGSYTVVFRSDIVLPDGATRTANWKKTISADGAVSGTGTIVWVKDGETVKTVNVTLGGTEEKETATAEAGEEKAEVVVPADAAPTATVTDESGTTAPVEIVTEADGTVAVSDEGEAEATAEAEAEATAEAEAEATAEAEVTTEA